LETLRGGKNNLDPEACIILSIAIFMLETMPELNSVPAWWAQRSGEKRYGDFGLVAI